MPDTTGAARSHRRSLRDALQPEIFPEVVEAEVADGADTATAPGVPVHQDAAISGAQSANGKSAQPKGTH